MDFIIEDGRLTRYIGKEENIVIPKHVKKIAMGAFRGCDELLSVTIPKSVIEIGHYAFAECKALTNIHIETGVREIKSGAFARCASLKSATLPLSVESVEDYAFSECTSLERFFLLGNCALGEGVFYQCVNLQELQTPMGLRKIDPIAFVGCKLLQAEFLDGMRFELFTWTDRRAVEDVLYLRTDDVEKKSYSWEEYQRITAQLLAYDLIYSSVECDEICGPIEPVFNENSVPMVNDMIVVREGCFLGCIVKSEVVCYVDHSLDREESRVLLKPGMAPFRIQSLDGSHCGNIYCYTDAVLNRRDI